MRNWQLLKCERRKCIWYLPSDDCVCVCLPRVFCCSLEYWSGKSLSIPIMLAWPFLVVLREYWTASTPLKQVFKWLKAEFKNWLQVCSPGLIHPYLKPLWEYCWLIMVLKAHWQQGESVGLICCSSCGLIPFALPSCHFHHYLPTSGKLYWWTVCRKLACLHAHSHWTAWVICINVRSWEWKCLFSKFHWFLRVS